MSTTPDCSKAPVSMMISAEEPLGKKLCMSRKLNIKYKEKK